MALSVPSGRDIFSSVVHVAGREVFNAGQPGFKGIPVCDVPVNVVESVDATEGAIRKLPIGCVERVSEVDERCLCF